MPPRYFEAFGVLIGQSNQDISHGILQIAFPGRQSPPNLRQISCTMSPALVHKVPSELPGAMISERSQSERWAADSRAARRVMDGTYSQPAGRSAKDCLLQYDTQYCINRLLLHERLKKHPNPHASSPRDNPKMNNRQVPPRAPSGTFFCSFPAVWTPLVAVPRVYPLYFSFVRLAPPFEVVLPPSPVGRSLPLPHALPSLAPITQG